MGRVAAGVYEREEAARHLGRIAIEAGRFLAAVPDRAAGRHAKTDGSPATDADLASERLIVARLNAIYPRIPVIAEESAGAATSARTFFLVDPLDGTRDYLDGSDEYAVSIALVEDGRPVAAAIAAPGLGRAWMSGASAWAATTTDGEPDWRPARTRSAPVVGVVALVSRRHGDAATEACLGGLPPAERRTLSSAAKFGVLASGEADLYIRCGPTMEWDTAAGDCLVHAAGGAMVGPSGRPLRYGRDGAGFRNGPFAATGDASLAHRIELPGSHAERAVST